MKTIAHSLRQSGTVGDPINMPWPTLNRRLKLHTKELVIVAGAPGAGKSVFALNVAHHLNQLILYMAMDSSPSVHARTAALAMGADISWVYEALRNDEAKQAMLEDLGDANPNLLINAGATTVGGIEGRLVALKELYGTAPKLVIIDNLIDMIVEGHVHTDTGFYAAALNPLKQMAIKHDVCVMALHHVTRRGGENGNSPHGLGTRALKMTDLLYSGEREAEHVIGVYHDHGKDMMNIQILKQRDGAADPEGGLRVPLLWHPAMGRLDKR